MSTHTSHPDGFLEVHTRRVALGTGGALREASVDCPRHGKQIDLEECTHCVHYQGLSRHPSWDSPVLACSEAHPDESGTGAARTRVSDLMSREVVCVRSDVSVETLRELLLERNISGVPVVNEAGRAIGVVTKTDLLREEEDRGDTFEQEPLRVHTRRGVDEELGAGFHAQPLARATAGEIMTPVAFSVSEDTSVARAAALMALEQVHRLVVVSADGKVAGMLSGMDVLRWLGESAGHLLPVSGWYREDKRPPNDS